ncbi:TFIIH complex subunit tfb5 [Elasticomyces elasticus]|nr:TFIIH complex subunit tfb5 [Elasticomyces elasticus]KAK4973460.1 TFIIH complex subunit tfb5 [Elasticomyces elasticus]
MPRAVKGTTIYLTLPGILIECDESIKAMIVKIDKEHDHDFIIENIDDKHALIKAERHEELRDLLKRAR